MNEVIKLSLKIENKSQIELNQLTLSLNALVLQYDSFLKKSEKFDYDKHERKLYISKLEQGSVIIDLIPAVMPLLQDLNSVIEFGTYLKMTFDYFLGSSQESKFKYSKQDCEQISEFLNQTAKDNGCNVNINVTANGNSKVLVCNFDSRDANAIQNSIRRFLDENEPTIPTNYIKECMYWANAKFVKNKNDHDGYVIIEKIDKKPKKVIFINENDKMKCQTRNTKYPNTEWNDLLYHVDVEAVIIQDKVKEYKILKVHDEVNTFDE